ncbi:hypothetical protein M378DRAFT_848614 [Amanita muscaria Koide BX008]|uniref:DUF6534 domain-containing protein n=1 Tax=Amanita muscaria (strain Koide BX008) TaxID=946122 RepID=A0A0C2WXY2_AMAMK|nr:hypothetical protein M378DRAFT_848614 [Amanita muscaria Koide BX008]
MLYGIANIQISYYYMGYPNDNIAIKILVFGLWLLETVHIVFSTFTVHHYLVENYGNPSALAFGNWSLFMSMGVNVTTASIAQCFFAYQIYHFCRGRKIRWLVIAVTVFMIIGHIAFGYENVVSSMMHNVNQETYKPKLEETVPFGTFAVLSDIAVAAALIFVLQNSSTGFSGARFSRTKRLVDTLTIYAIHRCLLTTVVAIAETIVYAVKPHSFYFLAIDFSIGKCKLWSNSLLATLNSRNHVREVSDNSPTLTSIKVSRLHFSDDSAESSNLPQ